MASSVMSPKMTLGHLLSAPNVMRCEKCRFVATDIAEFKKHMAQEHIEFYCFYCNSVSLSEAELQAHLKIHTATSPFKCPHCGHVYIRRMCLIKHIERFHSKMLPQEPSKINSTKPPHISVSSASPSVSSAVSSSSQRPAVRVTVPPPTATGLQRESNFQRLKSLDSYLSNAGQVNAAPSNGHVQRNRALTVPLPEEVSIPAGCMVEVAEVKTVDGTKELRLRFVAHQENESVIKKGRQTVPETSKVLSSHMNFQSTASEPQIRTVNNRKPETQIVNKDHPSRVTVNVPQFLTNLSRNEQCRSTKRPLPDVINLDADVPSKVSRSFIPVSDSKVATNVDPINHKVTPAALSSVFASRIASSVQPENLSARISPRGVEDRRGIQEHPSSSASIITSNVPSIPRIILAYQNPVTMKPNEGILLQKNKPEPTKPQQSSNTQFLPLVKPPSVVLPPQVRVSKECKDNFAPKTIFPRPDSSTSTNSLPVKKPIKTSNTHVQRPALPQDVKVENTVTEGVRVEPEGFPVISSVYSLSQQPDDQRESSQPIVMAEWTNSGGRDNLKIKSVQSEQTKATAGPQALSGLKQSKPSSKKFPDKIPCEPVKVEKDNCIQLCTPQTPNNANLKKEKSTPVKELKISKNKTCPTLKKSVNIPPKPPLVSESIRIQPVAEEDESENPSKFLTVSLKRVQVGVWEKCENKGKTVVSKPRSPPDLFGGLRDCTVRLLLPLRKDQAVKRPSPNQPVVILNHPKPSVHVKRRITNNRTNKGATLAPKCQILKMKLSKVTGQSYEVMGCTVQNIV